MKQLKRIFVRLFPLLILAFVLFVPACGVNDDAPDSNAKTKETPAAAQKSPVAKTAKNRGNSVPGWQQVSYENATFSLPEKWKGDAETGIWCPGAQNLDMGRPRVSLHIGATPVMPGSSVEDGLKRYYGVVPTATGEETKKCGKNGSYMEVTNNGLKHIGLILVEDMGMKIVHFFDCQAPGDEFDEQLETFRKILDSVECK